MIYPPGTTGGRSHRPKESTRNNKPNNADTRGRNGNRTTNKGKKTQQLIQWKQRNVQEGLVLVDENQLSKLIKREPIEKFYELDAEPFATGLFANVRRCRSRKTGEEFAAKFSSRARYGEDCSAEIYHEIALLSLCSPSPRIIKLHDVFETPLEIIIVLEFAPGGDLQTVIDNNLVPFESDVVKYVRQLLEGISYLHERKIAHLDIKPQNLVMMDDFPNGEVKICDFEISRIVLEDTEIREILGTPDYVAPEILHYEPITLAADMWSLGVTTYVLLTGFSPFGGETDQETFCNISQCDLDFPSELFEDVSEEAQDFIKKLIVREPKSRLTARECLRHPWLTKNSSVSSSVTVTDNKNKRTKMSDSSEINLRKYLSKSREALFERIIQKQQTNKNNLRKNTLLSQYNKTRMCESQMSLVSKSREKTMAADNPFMSPTFNRSREKLYGLRSLSKSHEVLDFCKAIREGAMQPDQTKTGILKSLTRATTADLSMLPTVQQNQHDNHCFSSMELEIVGTTPSKEEVSKQQQQKHKDNNTTVSDTARTDDKFYSDMSLKSPNLLKDVLRNTFEFSIANSAALREKYNRTEDITLNNDKNKNGTLNENESNDMLNKNSSDAIEEHLNVPNIDAKTKDEDSSVDTDTGEDSSSVSDSASENGDRKEIAGDADDSDDEPRFSVAQLVSAFNKHQEVVTKASLEVTMAATNSDTKISPVPDIAVDKFPTGPNALRLFIPDIDITTLQGHKKERRRHSLKNNTISEDKPVNQTEPEMNEDTGNKNSTESINSAELSKNTKEMNNNKNLLVDNIATVMSDPSRCEINGDRKDSDFNTLTSRIHNIHLTISSSPSYMRSSSLSSDTSGSRTPNDGFSSMEMSWEEMPSSPSEQQKALPRSQSKSPSTEKSNGNSWGKVCTGSYTRAMKKFSEKSNNSTSETSEIPKRKTSVHSSSSNELINNERMRKKSAPTMK